MHLGNVFCALLSWLSAKSKGGEWVLRIEDLDPQRSKKDYALQLMDDLQWLGLPWDGEPVWQSQRGDIYEEYLQRLTDMGLTYPCFCTRADIMATQAPHETDGRVVYKGTCRPKYTDAARSVPTATNHISPSIEGGVGVGLATTRLIVPDCTIPFTDGHYGKHDINLAEHCGDYIIRRKDGAWAYQLAVVVDDALMGVTEIVRGRDLLLSSPQQIHLRKLLFQSTDDRVQMTDDRVQSTDDRVQSTDDRVQMTDDRVQMTDDRVRSAEYRVQSTDDFLKRGTYSLTAQAVPLRQDERSGGGGLNVNPSPFTVHRSPFTAHPSALTVNFFHHPLLCNEQGQRLCKRDKSMDLVYLRNKGITPQEIIGKLAHYAGLIEQPHPISPNELLTPFSWNKIPTEDIITR